MKEVIDGKSYNTKYDSKFVAEYLKVIDGSCGIKCRLYQKKSTGEYFLCSDNKIDVISDEWAKRIIKKTEDGDNYLYVALTSDFKWISKGHGMWGRDYDNPFEEIYV